MPDYARISTAAAQKEKYEEMPEGPWRCRRPEKTPGDRPQFKPCLGVNEKEAQFCKKCGLQKKAYWACDLDDFNGIYPFSQWWELSVFVYEKKKASVSTALGKESTAQESAGQGVESQGSVQRKPQNSDEEN